MLKDPDFLDFVLMVALACLAVDDVKTNRFEHFVTSHLATRGRDPKLTGGIRMANR